MYEAGEAMTRQLMSRRKVKCRCACHRFVGAYCEWCDFKKCLRQRPGKGGRKEIMKKKAVWIGFVGGRMHQESDREYYGGVIHIKAFTYRTRARVSFEDVRKFYLVPAKRPGGLRK